MWNAFVRAAWRKLPVETAMVGLAALGAIGLVHQPHDVWCLRAMLAGIALTPLALAAHGLGRRQQALAIGAAAIGVAIALIVAVPDFEASARASVRWSYGLGLLAALLVPFVAAARRFTGFVRRFFEETTTWALLWGCAVAATCVIALALDELFHLRVDRPAQDALILLTAACVLLYVDRLLATDAASGRMPVLWRRLATAIGAPFVCIMLAILVVYEVVVVARGELPKNLLSPLILGAGFVGFLSTLIIGAVLTDEPTGVLTPADPHRWARRPSIRLVRAFPVVLLALLPMAGWALHIRIDAYGCTPFRVARAMGLLCLGTLCLAGALRWLRGQPPLSWQVPAAVIGFAILAGFGPLSAVELSISSQTTQLARLLTASGVGRVVGPADTAPQIELDDAAFRELQDHLEPLATLDGERGLRRVLSGSVDACADRWAAAVCLARLGVASRSRAPVDAAMFDLETAGRIPTEDGELEMIDLNREWNAATAASPGVAVPDGLVLTADEVVLYDRGAPVARAKLGALIAHRSGDRVLPPLALSLADPHGVVAAQLAIHSLVIQVSHGVAQAVRLSGAAIWRPAYERR